MDDVSLDTTIVELSEIESLSIRLINICKYNNLTDLSRILDHYDSHGHFLNIRNCGVQSSNELVRISQKYISLHSSNQAIDNESSDLEPDPSLIEFPINERYTFLQKTIFTNFINIQIRLVSVRLKNILSKYLNDDYTFDTFERLILFTHVDKLRNINGLGHNTFVELIFLIDSVFAYIDKVTQFNETNLLRELYTTYLQRYYMIEDEEVPLITSGYDFTRGIPIFKTVFYLFKLNKIFDRTERSLFFSQSNKYIDFSTENFSLDLSECTVSRQKIRIINKNLPSKLRECVTKIFTKDMKDIPLNTYSFDLQADFIYVDHKHLELIRFTENVSFTKEFVTFILSAIFEDTLFLIGDEECLYPHCQNFGHFEFRNFYLINRRFEDIFNFRKFVISSTKFLSDIEQGIINDSNDFRLFLKQFFLIDDYSEIDTIANICESIMYVQFPYSANFANLKNSSL